MAMRYVYVYPNSEAEKYLLNLLKEASTITGLEWYSSPAYTDKLALCCMYSFSDEMYYTIRKIIEERSA